MAIRSGHRTVPVAPLLALLFLHAGLWGQALSISPAAISLLGGGGLQNATVTVAAGTSWSASSNVSWITFPSGTSGTGSGTLAYQVAVNPSGTPARGGTITVTTTGGSATMSVNEAALVSGGPTAALLNPLTSGALPGQAQQTIQVQFTSPNGVGYLEYVQVFINNTQSSTNGCQVYYYPGYNQFYFVNNSTPTSVVLGPAGQVSGVHCSLNTGASSVVTSQSGITLNLALTLQPSAVGTQNMFLTAVDLADNFNTNGFSQATWSVYPEITQAPPTVALSAAPSGTSQTVSFQFSDGNGYTYLDELGVMLASNSSGLNSACLVLIWLPQLELYQAVNGNWNYIGWGNIGSGGTLGQAGTCSINLANSTISAPPANATPPNTTITVNLAMSMSGVPLPQYIYMSATDQVGRSVSNSLVGTWAGSAPAPTVAPTTQSYLGGGGTGTLAVTTGAWAGRRPAM